MLTRRTEISHSTTHEVAASLPPSPRTQALQWPLTGRLQGSTGGSTLYLDNRHPPLPFRFDSYPCKTFSTVAIKHVAHHPRVRNTVEEAVYSLKLTLRERRHIPAAVSLSSMQWDSLASLFLALLYFLQELFFVLSREKIRKWRTELCLTNRIISGFSFLSTEIIPSCLSLFFHKFTTEKTQAGGPGGTWDKSSSAPFLTLNQQAVLLEICKKRIPSSNLTLGPTSEFAKHQIYGLFVWWHYSPTSPAGDITPRSSQALLLILVVHSGGTLWNCSVKQFSSTLMSLKLNRSVRILTPHICYTASRNYHSWCQFRCFRSEFPPTDTSLTSWGCRGTSPLKQARCMNLGRVSMHLHIWFKDEFAPRWL